MTRDELEEALADSFDAAALAVYGDYLQGIGDPRGELIALDLHGDGGARRDELVVAWLGDRLAKLIHPANVDCGFLGDLYLEPEGGEALLHALAGSRAEDYLRGVTIVGDTTWVRHTVAWLSEHPRRWLDRLSIQRKGGAYGLAIGDDLGAELARATPRLQSLEVWGHQVLGDLPHPAVRSLCVTGLGAVGAIVGRGQPCLPALRLVDLACGDSLDRTDVRLDPARLPGVRRLDLSRNEPGMAPPHYLGGTLDPFELLASMPLRAQLTHVRLPALRTQRQADRLGEALAGMPAAQEVALARAYREFGNVVVPPRAIEPEPWPWLPADLVDTVVVMRFGNTSYGAPLAPAIAWFESRHDTLDHAVRTAWYGLLQLQYHAGVVPSLPRDVLVTIVDSIDDPELHAWHAIAARLHRVSNPVIPIYLERD